MAVTDRPAGWATQLRTGTGAWSWARLGLAGVLALAAGLNLYALNQNGYGNEYYAAAVRSMLQSWHTFFFASFDPGGFVTVDKPPAGLWLQTLSAWLLGFSGLSVLLPQALAGVASVAVLYHLVRRTFGVAAGLLAALALALTPIAVAINRTNELDGLLVLVLLLAAWAVTLAAETGRLRWLLAGAALVGVGFNVKMLEAYLVVPALVLVYLLGAPVGWWRRLGHLLLALVVLLGVSFAWAAAVDLTPPDQRPYVGSSRQNSEIDLAIGYNGLARVAGVARGVFGGRQPGAAATPRQPAGAENGPAGAAQNGTAGFPGANRAPRGGAAGANGTITPRGPAQGAAGQPPVAGAAPFDPAGFQGGQGGTSFGAVGFDAGAPGPLRLFGRQLAGQISWLLPLSVIGLLAAAWRGRPALPLDRRGQALLLWGGWLVTSAAVFSSMSGIFHPYYTVVLAPAVAAGAGIGLTTLWADWQAGSRRGWLLPIGVLATALFQARIALDFPAWGWLLPAVIGCGVAAAALLVAGRLIRAGSPRPAVTAAGVLVGLALFLGPGAWSTTPLAANANTQLPSAGPQRAGFGFGRGANNAAAGAGQARLIAYLEAHRGDAKFLLATPNAMSAAPIIIQTGEPVMALGGFMGADPILTADRFAALVADHTVRFVLTSGFARFGPGGGTGDISAWVQQSCRAVPADDWEPATAAAPAGPGGFQLRSQLYDCGG